MKFCSEAVWDAWGLVLKESWESGLLSGCWKNHGSLLRVSIQEQM